MQKKDLFFVLILFSVTASIFLALFYSFNTYFNEQQKIDSINLFPESQSSLIHEWTSNGRVCQYSSIVSKNDFKTYLIETVIFFNGILNMNSLKCLVKTKEKIVSLSVVDVLKIKLMGTSQKVEFAYKISCKLIDFKVEEENIFVSTIFLDDYKNHLTFENFLIFQKPNFYLKTSAKKNAIISCVHRFNRFDSKKFLDLKNWIKIQKLLGFEKIKIYENDFDEEMKNEILKANKNFIEFKPLETKFKDVCKYSLKNVKLYPNNSFFSRELNFCTENHKKFIGGYLKDLSIEDAVNRVNMNDCLFNAKYEYDYLTNYDFDEFILPRKYPTSKFLTFKPEKESNCSNLIDWSLKEDTYNIVKFANRLLTKYGPKSAFFEFSDFQLLEDFEQIKTKLLSRENNQKLQYNKSITYFTIEFENLEQKKLFENQTRVLQPFIDCLNKSIRLNKNVNPKWNNLYGIIVDNRQGKSIFLTKNTLTIHPHSALSIKSFTKGVKIPIEVGNAVHIRDSNTAFREKKKPNKFSIDLEFYVFFHNLIFKR